MKAGGCQLIDVREPVEHAESHVAGAKLMPLGQLEARCSGIDRSSPVVVMCQAGKRGAAATEKLLALGFTQARNLEGGILAWKSAGLPCAKGQKAVMPLMRQVQTVAGACILTGSLLAVMLHPAWVYLPMFFGTGLLFAGLSGWCGMGLLLAKMPWNQMEGTSCSN